MAKTCTSAAHSAMATTMATNGIRYLTATRIDVACRAVVGLGSARRERTSRNYRPRDSARQPTFRNARMLAANGRKRPRTFAYGLRATAEREPGGPLNALFMPRRMQHQSVEHFRSVVR